MFFHMVWAVSVWLTEPKADAAKGHAYGRPSKSKLSHSVSTVHPLTKRAVIASIYYTSSIYTRLLWLPAQSREKKELLCRLLIIFYWSINWGWLVRDWPLIKMQTGQSTELHFFQLNRSGFKGSRIMKRPSLNYRFYMLSRTQNAPDTLFACRWRNLHGPDRVVGLQLDADSCYVVYILAVGLTPLDRLVSMNAKWLLIQPCSYSLLVIWMGYLEPAAASLLFRTCFRLLF